MRLSYSIQRMLFLLWRWEVHGSSVHEEGFALSLGAAKAKARRKIAQLKSSHADRSGGATVR